MKNKREDIILSYFEGTMTDAEKRAFESEMEKDPDLKIDYLIFKSIHSDIRSMNMVSEAMNDPDLGDAISLADETVSEYYKEKESSKVTKDLISLKKEMSSIDKNEKIPSGTRTIYLYISVAAAIIVAVLILRKPLFEVSADKLYSAYYKPPEMSLKPTRGGEAREKEDFNLAYGFYMDKKIGQADSVLNRMAPSQENEFLYHYLTGLVRMENGNFKQAVEFLSTKLNRNDPLYLEKNWYLALCNIRLGKIEDAKNSLEIMAANEGKYQADAEDLLRKIDRLKR